MTLTACPAVEVLDEDSFANLAPEWESLLTRSYDNRIFLTPTWHRLWWEHFGNGRGHLVTARDDERLTGVLPLMIAEEDGRRVLTLTGDFNVMDYMDAVAEKEAAQPILEAMWRRALDELEWDALDLRHIPSGSLLIPALSEVTGGRLQAEEEEVDPVVLLCGSWDGYLQMLGKKHRHEIRRKMRRATAEAEWAMRTAKSATDIEELMPEFFRLHELSAREKARFMTPDMRQYFVAMAKTFVREGYLRLNVFIRDGVNVAATLGFLYRERYLLYNSGYDPAYAEHSPGIAAVAETIKQAIEEKAVAFDFLSGDEPYKYQFGASNTFTCRLRLER